jgi:copper chaperone
MLTLRIPDMSCGHCAATVENAVKSVDPDARVAIDLAARTATISASVEPAPIQEAMRVAGYDSQLVED